MASPAARRADNIVRNIWFIWAEPAFVLVGATVCTAWTVGFTECSVELGQLSQLHPTEIVVTLWDLYTLPNDVLDAVDRFLYRLRVAGGDERMQRLVLSGQRLAIFTANFALLYRTLAANDNFRPGVLFHRFKRVSTGADEEAYEVDVRVFLLRNEDFVADTNHWWSEGNAEDRDYGRFRKKSKYLLVIRWWLKLRIHALHTLNQLVALLLELLPRSKLARVQTLTITAINWLR